MRSKGVPVSESGRFYQQARYRLEKLVKGSWQAVSIEPLPWKEAKQLTQAYRKEGKTTVRTIRINTNYDRT